MRLQFVSAARAYCVIVNKKRVNRTTPAILKFPTPVAIVTAGVLAIAGVHKPGVYLPGDLNVRRASQQMWVQIMALRCTPVRVNAARSEKALGRCSGRA